MVIAASHVPAYHVTFKRRSRGVVAQLANLKLMTRERVKLTL